MRADVFVAGIHSRFGLVFEAVKECLRNLLLEIDPRKLADHFRANLGGEGFGPDTESIQGHAVVQKFHFQGFVRCYARRGVKRYRVPGGLNAGVGHAMMLEKLTYRVRTIDFETVSGTTELLKQTQIVESRADEHKLHIELLSRLAPHLVRPEEDAMRMIKQQRRAE